MTSNLKTAPFPQILRLEITQMKFTYLVYKQVNGTRQLAAATQEEWDAILKKKQAAAFRAAPPLHEGLY